MSTSDETVHKFHLSLDVVPEMEIEDLIDIILEGADENQIEITAVVERMRSQLEPPDEIRAVDVVILTIPELTFGTISRTLVSDLESAGIEVGSVTEFDAEDPVVSHTNLPTSSIDTTPVLNRATEGGYPLVCPNHHVPFEEGGRCPYGDYP